MKLFGFYSRIDSAREILNKVKAYSLEEALIIFVSHKQLSIDNFLSIYDVIELN